MKKILALLLALSLMLALAACTQKPAATDPVATDPAATTSGTQDPQQSTEITPEQIASVQREVVNIGITADCTNFNPWSYSGAGGNAAIWPIYQPLGYYVDDTFYPSLAKSVVYADDGMSIDVELFDYIKDSAGNHITADDAVFSYNASTLVWPEQADIVKDVVKTGEYTFRFDMQRPLRYGDHEGLVRGHVVSQKAFEASKDEMHSDPVGTGPYKLTKYESGYMFTYEKVDDWWQTDESQIYPRDLSNVNTINWYVITESAQRTIALQQGIIDMCASINSSELEKFDGKDGYHLYSFDDNLSMYLFPNCDTTSPLKDLNLRLAVSYAVSAEGVLNGVYGGNGTVMYSLAPNWEIGYQESWEKEDNYYKYDDAKAKEYLNKSSYNGEDLTIICDSSENSTNTATLVVSFLQQIGVKSHIASYESTVFRQYIQDPTQWDIQIATATGNGEYYQAVAYSLLSQQRFQWKGSINFIYDDELENLIETCMTPQTATDASLAQLRKHIVDNCYLMGLVNIKTFVVVPDWNTDVTLSIRKTIIPGGGTYTKEK